jgi:hypothetical protein
VLGIAPDRALVDPKPSSEIADGALPARLEQLQHG